MTRSLPLPGCATPRATADSDAAGVAPLGNGVSGAPFGGVYLSDSTNCRIGGPLAPNFIAFNEGNGVTVFSFGATAGNTVRGNFIYGNAARAPSSGLGIDLGDDGPTANDLQDTDGGVNGLQNAPIIQSVLIGASDVEVVGRLNSTPSTTFDHDFYAADASFSKDGSVQSGYHCLEALTTTASS